MDPQLLAQIAALIAEGRGETWDTVAVLPLLDLESGSRFGLDPKGIWVTIMPGHPAPLCFGPGTERRFAELLETPRAEVEQLLDARARAYGLPSDPLTLSVPSIELVRAVLGSGAAHFTRLGLLWLLPSELRLLRKEIAAVAVDNRMPRTVKEIAQRLVVPE
ncbi:MAG: hypothetical protein IT373_01200 [Polyangiaceae bacterium]|nr:hypothetical protein [Polyangiaceae bacterium]